MKIVDVAEFYADQGGGVKTYINQKLEAGVRHGHEVVVIAPGDEDREEERHGGRVLWVKGPHMPFDPRYFVLYRQSAVHELLDREQPDIVEGSSVWTGGWFAARWQGEAARSLIFHQDPIAVYPETFLDGMMSRPQINKLFGWYWGYLRLLANRYDTTVTAGDWLADKLRRHGVDNAAAVPFGIDKSRFSPNKVSQPVRRKLQNACGVGPEAPLLVTVSRFHPEKRLFTLLEAFKEARKSYDIGWVLYGHGPLRGAFDRKAAEVDGIHVAGFTENREELATALASCDAMLHGSAAETFGLVVAEGLCSGLPIISPDIGGAADLVESNSGIHYRTGDAMDCARAIRSLVYNGREFYEDGVRYAAERRVQTIDDHFQNLFSHYRSLKQANQRAAS
jgi:alpha-1,6-mannosyltransferase